MSIRAKIDLLKEGIQQKQKEKRLVEQVLARVKIIIQEDELYRGKQGEQGVKPVYKVDYLTPEELEALEKALKPADGKDGKDGKDADTQEIIRELLANEVFLLYTKAKNPPTASQVANLLNNDEQFLEKVKGEKGDKGDTPNHEWKGTKLRFEKPNGGWGKWVDLKGFTATIQASSGGGEGVGTDHGSLLGLLDDDHTQYALADGTRGNFAPPLGANDNYVTDAEKVVIGNTSGTNTGDQNLSGYLLKSGDTMTGALRLSNQADALNVGAYTMNLKSEVAESASAEAFRFTATTALSSGKIFSLYSSTTEQVWIGVGKGMFGSGNTVTGGFAFGQSNNASGSYGTAMGFANTVASNGSVAMGLYCNATNLYCTAIGFQNTADSAFSLALGTNNKAQQTYAVAIGYGNTVTANNGLALGSNIYLTAGAAVGACAVGFQNTVGGSINFGYGQHYPAMSQIRARGVTFHDTVRFFVGDSSTTSGTELVTNGTFTGSLTGWATTGTSWSYASNAASNNGLGLGDTLTQTITGLVIGAMYALKFTISGVTGATGITPSLATSAITFNKRKLNQTTVREVFVARATSEVLTFTSDDGGGVIVLDTVSVQRVTAGNASVSGTSYLNAVTLFDSNVTLGTTTGTKLGTATTEKLGFWNATPIVQPANTTTIDTLLTNTGLRASGGTANFGTAVSAPSAQIGDASNYLSISSTGTIRFTGTATVFDDLRVAADAAKLGGSKDPGFAVFKTNGAGSQGVFLYWFDKSVEEELYFSVQLPHKWKEGSTIYPHIHWVPKTTGGTGLYPKWGLEYTWSNLGSTFSNTTIIYSDASTAALATTSGDTAVTADKHYISIIGSGGITASGKTISSMLICRVFRAATDGTDDYDDDAGMLEIDFHYEMDSLGSESEYAK